MNRQTAIATINELPKDFNVEVLIEKLLFLEKVQIGLKEADEGKLIPHEQVVEDFKKKWEK